MKFKTNSEYNKSQTLIKKIFLNKESIVINDQLTIEVKYGGLASYTPEYIKQTLRDAYGAWSDNFYSQKSVHSVPVNLQLYELKSYDDYKAHIKELSTVKDHRELWGGGTVRAHETDGTIAKTFIVGDVNGLLCAKSKILMEKMSDAFLEYSTGNMDTVPEVLRTGMKLFMWSYNKLLIKQLLTEMSFNRVEVISKFKHLLDNSEVEKEFKQWVHVNSGDKIVSDLVPDSEVMTYGEHKLQININYDDEELTQSKLSSEKNAIESIRRDFDSAFGINNSQLWHNILNNVNVFVFNTKSDYENYLKGLNVSYKGKKE